MEIKSLTHPMLPFHQTQQYIMLQRFLSNLWINQLVMDSVFPRVYMDLAYFEVII